MGFADLRAGVQRGGGLRRGDVVLTVGLQGCKGGEGGREGEAGERVPEFSSSASFVVDDYFFVRPRWTTDCERIQTTLCRRIRTGFANSAERIREGERGSTQQGLCTLSTIQRVASRSRRRVRPGVARQHVFDREEMGGGRTRTPSTKSFKRTTFPGSSNFLPAIHAYVARSMRGFMKVRRLDESEYLLIHVRSGSGRRKNKGVEDLREGSTNVVLDVARRSRLQLVDRSSERVTRESRLGVGGLGERLLERDDDGSWVVRVVRGMICSSTRQFELERETRGTYRMNQHEARRRDNGLCR
jgi:hypothetical protein